MGEENKKTNNQVVTTVKESKTNHEKSNKVFYGDGKQVLPVGVLDYNDFSPCGSWWAAPSMRSRGHPCSGRPRQGCS